MGADYSMFKMVFHYLANDTSHVTEADWRNSSVKFAKKLWELSLEYDFDPADMDIDKDLITLGLAKKKKCGCIVYKGMDQSCRDDHGV